MSDEQRYEFFMPFVTTTDAGGPHDPASYIAGFETGALDARLKMLAAIPVVEWRTVLHRENLPQVDLIAMAHGYAITEEPVEDDGETENIEAVRAEWAILRFDKVPR